MALVGGAGSAPAGSAYATEPPGVSGDIARPNYMGPSGNGLVERMNAGRNPCGMIVIGGGHCPFQKAIPRSKENASGAPRGAPVRVTGRQSRPLTGEAMPQGRPMGAAFRAREFRRSASLYFEVAKGSN